MKKILLCIFFITITNFLNAEVYKEYYPNGSIYLETSVINGSMEGVSKSYYPNGQLSSEIEYRNNMKSGVAKFYNENGRLIGKITFKDDIAIKTEKY